MTGEAIIICRVDNFRFGHGLVAWFLLVFVAAVARMEGNRHACKFPTKQVDGGDPLGLRNTRHTGDVVVCRGWRGNEPVWARDAEA